MELKTKNFLIDIEKDNKGYKVILRKKMKSGSLIFNGNKDILHGDKIEIGEELTVFRENIVVFKSSKII